jgi:hypothetical protein
MTYLTDGEHARDIAVAQNIQHDVPSEILEVCSHFVVVTTSQQLPVNAN